MTYDKDNVFAKIIRGEMNCEKIYEDDSTIAFDDINKQAPVHILVIPKGHYKNLTDFVSTAGEEEVGRFFKKVDEIANSIVKSGGYRIISNIMGDIVKQQVMHFHVHILGGARFSDEMVTVEAEV